MPKAKRPGNQHNPRHENGIVAPGKRVAKQKSNSHLNGSNDASPQAGAGPLPPTSNRANTTAVDYRTNGNLNHTQSGSYGSETRRYEASPEHGDGTEYGQGAGYAAKGSVESVHRNSEARNIKSQGASNSGVLNLAFTILRACPIGDTIAILLVLLWLPPTLLTVTNALFAVLTFMPPTLALPSFPPTFNDIFVGSGNTPSLATIFLTDFIGFLTWIAMWTPVQTVALELAQAVVATTLGGGGSSSKSKGSDSTLLCMALVMINHTVRNNGLPRRLFGFDWPAILSSIPYLSQDSPLNDPDDENNATRSPTGWFRAIVALHILIQGLVHVLRRWYQKREYAQAVQLSKKLDGDASTGSPARPNNLTVPEGGIHGHPDSPARALASKEARDKIMTGKKKKKQSNVVRSQQPLWAAFAATKLTVLREYEQSQALKEVAEANAIDTRNLGSVPFVSEADRVWISNLTANTFTFSTTLLLQQNQEEPALEGDAEVNINQSSSLHVRINDTDWTSMTIQRAKRADGKDEWQGEVFGLTPASSYRCNFTQGKGGATLYSMTVTTPPLLPVNNDISTTAADSNAPIYRPSTPTSPKTTLKKSIAAFETNLNETQSRQKRSKKDNKAALANLKKDIDVLTSKVAKIGGEDKAHMNRQLQWNQNTKQAEEAIAEISDEIEALGAIPEDDIKSSEETKAAWEEVKEAHTAAREEMLQVKEAASRERQAIQAEAHASQQKRERLLSRKAKLSDQYEKLESATTEGLNAKERKNSEQAAKDLERAQLDQKLNEQMANYYRAFQESQAYLKRGYQQIQAFETAFQEQQMINSMPAPIDRPLTPEGDLPGTNPQNAQAAAFRVPAFGSTDTPGAGLRSHSGSLRRSDVRPRSTSGLSGNSGYADFDDQDPAPPMPSRAVRTIRDRGRQHSGGSGSGSGSSGSQRDPASPLVGSAAQASPVGKRSPVWNS